MVLRDDLVAAVHEHRGHVVAARDRLADPPSKSVVGVAVRAQHVRRAACGTRHAGEHVVEVVHERSARAIAGEVALGVVVE